jgi:hypothetical protein
MEQKHIIASVLVLVLIVLGMFIFAGMKHKEIVEENTPPAPVVEETTPYDNITRIDAKHFFDGKTHTLVGEILMPTPCDLLNWSSDIAESMPEQVTVRFDVINDADMCAQVMTPQRFKVSFDASQGANIRVLFMGKELPLNLVPALPGESPDDFEVFIKG